MKPNLTSFVILLVGGLVLLMFGAWVVSALVLAERQGARDDNRLQQNLQAQVIQLRQNQQLWLQSQYYLLNNLAGSPQGNDNFQSFLWGYYQRNPSVWAVNLVQFDDRGQPLSKSSKPGCLQPDQLLRFKFDNFLVPRILSCRIDDKALLEIAGPVVTDGEPVMLLVSMDYFAFLDEFSDLTGRRLQRAADSEQVFQFHEFGSDADGAAQVRVELVESGDVFGELYFDVRPPSLWAVFDRQAAAVLGVMLLGALLALALLYWFLLRPLQALSHEMRIAVHGRQPEGQAVVPPLRPGLGKLHEYFSLMQKTARLDPVTGLNNRVIFEDRLAQAIREGKRSGRQYALVLIDIQGLDEFAHQRGQYLVDALLRQVAESMRERLRESDHLSRFERNLFALLLEFQQRDQLHGLVEKLYLSLIRRYRVYDREFDLDAYIGAAVYPDHAITASQLYEKASEALLAAEHSEWPIEYYHEENDESDTSGFTIIQSLRRAIERDELKLVFQPVVDMESYRTVYLEALLRWKDPERHDISIEDTIRLAEQNQLIKSLSNWIFENACRFLDEQAPPNTAVGINLSMIDLHDRRLPERLQGYIDQYHVRPQQIVIEITEGQIMQEPEKVIDVLAHLGVMGLSLSIDDFGTGQASLTYLKEMPVEKLKIDQSFVREMVSNPDDQLIVRATIELAHTLDIKVVAEGVESLAIYELLTGMGCDHAQGYYISRPLEADQVGDWYQTSVKPDILRKGN